MSGDIKIKTRKELVNFTESLPKFKDYCEEMIDELSDEWGEAVLEKG